MLYQLGELNTVLSILNLLQYYMYIHVHTCMYIHVHTCTYVTMFVKIKHLFVGNNFLKIVHYLAVVYRKLMTFSIQDGHTDFQWLPVQKCVKITLSKQS